jgi:glycosyltransferase involved in cell wall biosynthesis
MSVGGDALISLDADLQDDLSIIPDMIRAFRSGDELVYAVRRRRDNDTFFKRFTAEGYYKVLAAMGVEVVFNHADYRLMGRRPLEALRSYGETHLFLRGMIPQLGYRSSVVAFDRAERFAGESKYPLSKMLSLAWRGVTSFSAAPLRAITGLGAFVSVISVGLGLWALFIRLFTEVALPGWASTVIPMYLLGGIQLLSLGVIGEYLAKVYEASKQRPRFHVEAITGHWGQP